MRCSRSSRRGTFRLLNERVDVRSHAVGGRPCSHSRVSAPPSLDAQRRSASDRVEVDVVLRDLDVRKIDPARRICAVVGTSERATSKDFPDTNETPGRRHDITVKPRSGTLPPSLIYGGRPWTGSEFTTPSGRSPSITSSARIASGRARTPAGPKAAPKASSRLPGPPQADARTPSRQGIADIADPGSAAPAILVNREPQSVHRRPDQGIVERAYDAPSALPFGQGPAGASFVCARCLLLLDAPADVPPSPKSAEQKRLLRVDKARVRALV